MSASSALDQCDAPMLRQAAVVPLLLPAYDETLIPLDAPLSPLAQALVMGCLALAEQLGHAVPTITDPAALRGAEGLEVIHDALGDMFPGLGPAVSDSAR